MARVAARLSELNAAAHSAITTFFDAPSDPLTVGDPNQISREDVHLIADRYSRHGFVTIQLPAGQSDKGSATALANSLGLGEPFLPPLYRLGGRNDPIARISASVSDELGVSNHPSFERAGGQRMHCDGTLQPIGYIKASLLLCVSPAAAGGDTLLFNASGAYTELLTIDPAAALALATPGILIRQANINGSNESDIGPAYDVQHGQLVCRYCVSDTDRWAVPEEVDEQELLRGLDYLGRASRRPSGYFLQFRLAADQAIIFDNTRVSHGRTSYSDSTLHHRCLYRSLHLWHPRGYSMRRSSSVYMPERMN